MRNLDEYDLIVVDIDDTIIHGFWTDIMHYTWKWFRSDLLSSILMRIQNKFNLYKLNQKLVYMLKNTKTPIVVMTVRKENEATAEMIYKILDKDFTLYELQTDYGYIMKPRIIEELLQVYPKVILFDDNKMIRDNVAGLEVDVVDPVAMREEFIQ